MNQISALPDDRQSIPADRGALSQAPADPRMIPSAPAPADATIMVPVPLADLFRIANEYEQAGRLDDAAALLRRMLAVAPLQPDALHLSGIVAFRQGRMEEAADLVEQAIAHGVNTPLYYRNICTIYERLGRHQEAVIAGRRAVELDPCDPHALHNLTVVYYRLLELDESIACARRAIALDPTLPGPHFALAEALLLRGEFAEGWAEYEWRYQIPGAAQMMPKTDRPQWDGTALPAGQRLMLVADQGFGDVIQFGRMIPWVAARCPTLSLACSRELQPLMRQMLPGLDVFDRWDDRPDFAAYCPLSGLPRLYGVRLGNIPGGVPYLQADPSRAAAWRARLAGLAPPGYRRVGLVWAGRPTHNNDINRSAALAEFAPLAAVDGVALVSLQKGPAQAQTGAYYGRAQLLNVSAEIEDFEDTAAIIAGLDLLVTVDTSVAHLAGAMGRPVWVLLPHAPDWRWLLDRADTPWYPSMRLFRQRVPRNWSMVMGEIAAALAALPRQGEPQTPQ